MVPTVSFLYFHISAEKELISLYDTLQLMLFELIPDYRSACCSRIFSLYTVRFEAFTTVKIQVEIFSALTPYSKVVGYNASETILPPSPGWS
jgi:hypothetical protein